jgi:serine protein kinase
MLDLNSWIDQAHKDNESPSEIHSFNDYLNNIFERNPEFECRPSYRFLIDMLEHFGKNEDGSYKLFELEHPDAPAVFGQKRTQVTLLQNLQNFAEEGFNNKFILLVGPNGSSKSSLVRKLMKGAELYSQSDAGRLYTFSWIFPIDTFVKGSLGLAATPASTDLNTFAYLEDKEVNAILNSELKDHPLLLIPRKFRQEIIDQALAKNPELHDSIKKSYLYKGDLSKKNRMIYDALLKNYKGRHSDVLKHIRVERFTISKRYSNSAVTIEPQLHVDARMQQITMDKRLASLPPSLQSLNLFSLQGEAVMANRGILEYSDLLKRPLDAYKYLLMTMESATLNLQGVLTELDIFFIGTSNEVHLAAFKQHPDFNSFKGRFSFVRVPYLLDYKEEMKIYESQIEGLDDKATFEPHSLTALCLFAVMTRLRACQTKNYPDTQLSEIVSGLTPLEKALFISTKDLPDRLDSEKKQILKQAYDEIADEFANDNLYEGKFGISPRDLKLIIYKLAPHNPTITFVEVIEYLKKLINKKNDYDFLNMTPQGDYHNPSRFIHLLKDHFITKFDQELRESLGLIDDRSYEDYIKRYVENVNSLLKGERVKNPITGKYEEHDEYFINEFEGMMNLSEEPKSYRSHLISKMGAWYLDNPGKKIVYTNVFPEVARKLQESFRDEQKKVIQNVAKNLVFYEAELNKAREGGKDLNSPLTAEGRDQIQTIVNNLSKKYGYSPEGALSALKYTIKERY